MGSIEHNLLLTGEQYRESKTKNFPLGMRGYTRDGRVFRYCKNGAVALTKAKFVQAEAISADDVAQELAPQTQWTLPTTNSTSIRLATACSLATADFYKDGYIMVTAGSSGPSCGQMLQIEGYVSSSAVAGADGCGKVNLYSEDKLTRAITTANKVSLIKNPYDDVIVTPSDTALAAIPIGVTPIDVTADYYFWVQTWGMCATWVNGVDASVAIVGRNLYFTSNTAAYTGDGYVQGIATSTAAAINQFRAGAPSVGMAQYIGVNGTCCVSFLTLAP